MGDKVNLEDVAKAGFFLPVLSLADSTITYALTQMINGLATVLPNSVPTISSTMSNMILAFGILVGFTTFAGYFEDFGKGWSFPGKSLLYSVCAIAGLWYFWAPLSNMYPKELGTDVIWSTILTIAILIISSLLSLYAARRNSGLQYSLNL